MMSIVCGHGHHCNWRVRVGVQNPICKSRFNQFPQLPYFRFGGFILYNYTRKYTPVICCSSVDDLDGNDSEEEDDEVSDNKDKAEAAGIDSEMLRKNLERIVGADDSNFSGIDLATLIRNKYGRSYDVQLIKKEFMGRNLLALNVMWKYVEQRSFPLTEEEYLLRLDDVANTLKCWGAVSHIRSSLAKSKERPRIGKAVSIFIDMDETGGRANEWIYK
ncbi:hypothetical protein JCGZ_11913 [Jatropha curcas]|uniref:Uncharacterized protein n=2 Tax=Jatropha curcas TaxID=180498 RepID=A0A067KE98_JATCU|nr:hypothetical protein JCGZ_11913 [Jatropha curcas]